MKRIAGIIAYQIIHVALLIVIFSILAIPMLCFAIGSFSKWVFREVKHQYEVEREMGRQ